MSEQGRPLRDASQDLLFELEGLRDDPVNALVTMQKALGCDLGIHLGFQTGYVAARPAEVQLSIEQYEAIKSLEEVVKLFCNYGTLEPNQIGSWLNIPNPRLEASKPIEVLFSEVDEHGFNPKNTGKVLEAGQTFLRRREGAQQAIGDIIRR